ncbi:sigma-70 family RNA polymerase sigma factor [Acidicapsa acidisoli]|uniref:sigma-70 family RNA polymerase sigma factor n=1 Tax=Acidicapsa acidisoli TaxID=1615681 RepID=UPI0021E096C5|nr:FliA/WhiG family RNA polymerase sigma factor [Acidicapsa acidisoli]
MRTRTTTHAVLPGPVSKQKVALIDYLPMVRFQAKKIHRRLPSNVEIDDLYAAGLVGLWEAYAKFNPGKNVQFSTFAQFRVRGAILDSLRSVDWAPRNLRSKGRAIQEAVGKLTSRLNRAPSEEEVAAELKISLETYQHLLGELHSLEVGTIHRTPDEDSGDEVMISIPGAPGDDPLFRCLRGEVTDRIAGAIENLSENERLVVTLFYYEELTRRQVSEALGMTEARVQQIRNSAVLHLRSALSDLARSGNKGLKLVRKTISKSLQPVMKLGPAA